MRISQLFEWIASATLRSRQAYFVPRNDVENFAVLRKTVEITFFLDS